MKVSKFSNVKNNRNKLDRTSTYHNTKKTKRSSRKGYACCVLNLLGTDSFHQVAQSRGNYIALIATR